MSAFMCSEEHINAIVTYAYMHEIEAYLDGARLSAKNHPQRWVDILTKANRDSLLARYGDQDNSPVPTFERARISAKSVQIVKLCHSYNYQACEVEDYETTRAYKLISTVLDHILRGMAGYEDAEWAI